MPCGKHYEYEKLNKVEGDAIKSLKVSRGERVFLGEIGEQQ